MEDTARTHAGAGHARPRSRPSTSFALPGAIPMAERAVAAVATDDDDDNKTALEPLAEHHGLPGSASRPEEEFRNQSGGVSGYRFARLEFPHPPWERPPSSELQGRALGGHGGS